MINTICSIIILTLYGALVNRIRGGLELPGLGELPLNKLWQPLTYGLPMANFASSYCPEAVSPITYAVLNCLTMYLGQQICGWGTYIGELTTGQQSSREECPAIDELIKNISSPRVYGFCGLCLRGLVWTFLIGLPLYSIPLMLSGLLMGPAYLIATLICQALNCAEGKNAWNLGEWVWGGLLWFCIALTAIV